MALEAQRATFNAAVDVLSAAWETLGDAVAAGEEIQIVRMKRQLDATHTATTLNANKGIDASLTADDWDFGKKYKILNTPDVLDSFHVGAGGIPLFFKVTNNANELS